jgi:hypothetical protein
MKYLELYRFRKRSGRSLILARQSQNSSQRATHQARRHNLAGLNFPQQSQIPLHRSIHGKGRHQSLASLKLARQSQNSLHQSFTRARRHSLRLIHPSPKRRLVIHRARCQSLVSLVNPPPSRRLGQAPGTFRSKTVSFYPLHHQHNLVPTSSLSLSSTNTRTTNGRCTTT